jgi:hypothetical protein
MFKVLLGLLLLLTAVSIPTTSEALPIGPAPLRTPGLTVVDWAESDGMVLAVLRPSAMVFAPVGSTLERFVSSSASAATLRSRLTPASEIKTGSTAGWTSDLAVGMFEAVHSGSSAANALRTASGQRSAAADPVVEGTFRGCHEAGDSSWVLVRGCSFYNDGDVTPSGRYLADSTWASARMNAKEMDLTAVFTQHTWENHGGLMQYAPQNTILQGSCNPVTLGVSFGGASISETHTFCPDMIDPKLSPQPDKQFLTTWRGRGHLATRYVEAATVSLIPVAAAPSGFAQEIGTSVDTPESACGFVCDFIISNLLS